MKVDKWIKKNCSSLEGKVIAITGTTGGIGARTLEILASLKAELVVGVRRVDAAKSQCEEIEKKTGCKKIKILYIDLCNPESILNFAKEVSELYPDGIDALINNAGMYARKDAQIVCDLKAHFFANCVGTIYLSELLLPLLNKKENSKLISEGSIGYAFTKIDLDDPDFKKRKTNLITYSNTKRWLAYSLSALKDEAREKYKNVCVTITHPGVTGTALFTPKSGKIKKLLFKFPDFLIKVIFPSVKKACLSEVYALFVETEKYEWIGPTKFFRIYGYPKVKKFKLKDKNKETERLVYEKVQNFIKNIEK